MSSPGLGYFLIKSDDVELSLEGGSAYVWQKLDVKDEFLASRAANDFSWKLSETAKIFQTAEFLLNTDETEEYIIVGTAGLEASLTSTLALVTYIQDRFNSVPANDKQKNDVLITTALKVAFESILSYGSNIVSSIYYPAPQREHFPSRASLNSFSIH